MPPFDEIHIKDPCTGEVVANYPCATDKSVHAACSYAKEAFKGAWRDWTGERRALVLWEISGLIKANQDELAKREARETGKSLETARSEIEGVIKLWQYASSLARQHGKHAFTNLAANSLSLIISEPVGVVAMIVPWNYPSITTSERLPFALAAGCCVVVKPSELAAGALPYLFDLIASNNLLPDGVLQLLFGKGDVVGKKMYQDPFVDMVSFVGSSHVGRKIESEATRLGKKVSAELGGNNFALVYADADLKAAAKSIIIGGLRNGGQACIASTHVLLDPLIADEMMDLLSIELETHYPPNTTSGDKQIQPMITLEHKQRIQKMIDRGRSEGVAVLSGSKLTGVGNRIGPVIFNHVPLDSFLLQDEIFGPVITITVLDETNFIDAVHSSPYGLAAYAWTRSTAKALAAMSNLRVGRIWINADPNSWFPELPVGGFGESGTGRELGPNALDTYSLTKSVILN